MDGCPVQVCSHCFCLLVNDIDEVRPLTCFPMQTGPGTLQQFAQIHPFDAYDTLAKEVRKFPFPKEKTPEECLQRMEEGFTRRDHAVDTIFRIGDGAKLCSDTIHGAIRYLDLVVNTILNRYEEDEEETLPSCYF